jgi:DNA-binding GntR family transcriptional regulator
VGGLEAGFGKPARGQRRGGVKVARATDEQTIYTVLSRALLSARVAPGTKLGEHKLAGIFGVTRERIRKVLHRLGHDRLIDVIPNRGAFVVNPTLDESRLVYQARRIVESGIVASLAEHLTDRQIARLEENVDEAADAIRRGDRVTSMRLSGAFHMVLAEMTGNSFIVRQMQELVIRTTMLDAFFDSDISWSCGCDEHREVSQALARRDGPAAVRAMATHLSLVETRFRPQRTKPVEADLITVLQDETAQHMREIANCSESDPRAAPARRASSKG